MKIGAVTDEIFAADLEKSLAVATELGIENFELRRLWNKRVPLLTEKEISRLEGLISKYQVKITALSPGIFKIPLSSPELAFHKGELLARTIELGKRLAVKRIIIFGIKREKRDQPKLLTEVIQQIRDITEQAREEGFEILLENEPGWWADTAEHTRQIITGVNLSNFRLNWDPGNLVCTGQSPYPEGYQIVKDYVGNVHFKDALFCPDNCEWKPAGQGEVNWSGQIRALKDIGYQGMITIETHCPPLLDNFRLNYLFLKNLLNSVSD
ncbi:MAG: sugar phosphate isomerase/epimerase [Halanaerobiales bacterium]|nr:sugar phosphate isomerase/epimerase [Halanaerobiales bacterium]